MIDIIKYFNSDFYFIIGMWSIILGTFIIIMSSKMKSCNDIYSRVKRVLSVICSGLLASDIISILFMGIEGNTAAYAVRITVYIVFCCKYIYICLFSIYIQNDSSTRRSKSIFSSIMIGILSMISIILVSVSNFNNCIYYFDSENYFYYGKYYPILRTTFLISLIIIMVTVIKNIREYNKGTRFIFSFYLILLISTTLLDYIIDMWYLQNITIFFSTQLIFLNDMFNISEEYTKSKKKLIIAEYEAEHDLMTGLWNKKSGLCKIEQYINSMTAMDKAVLGFVDIDNFKHINDSYGHETGDYWIKEISELLLKACEKDDIVCRYGGDEFIVFYRNIKDIGEIKKRLDQFKLNLHMQFIEHMQDVHCSIGAYYIHESGKRIKECIERADAALYEVKESGKGNYKIV